MDLTTDPTAREELTKMEKWLDNLGLIGVDFSNFTASFASAPNSLDQLDAFAELMAPPIVVHTGPPPQPQQQQTVLATTTSAMSISNTTGTAKTEDRTPQPNHRFRFRHKKRHKRHKRFRHKFLKSLTEKVLSLADTQKIEKPKTKAVPKEKVIDFMQSLYDSIKNFKEAMKVSTALARLSPIEICHPLLHRLFVHH
ncbi:unnamed protein product [Caenorhabditis sp. 36 PRJEB53466]|nr:unnamed protein product [Caenorhabditis sp. 36 PRJEB53466]